MLRVTSTRGGKISIRLNEAQARLIRDYTVFGADIVGRGRKHPSGGIRITVSRDDLEHIHGFIAGEANHCRNAALQDELDELYLDLQDVLDSTD